MRSYNPIPTRRDGLGSSLFARHYSGNHYYFLFLPVLRCFSSRGWLSFECYAFSVTGCPIRKSADITLVCSSPQLIAAYHVLHRLSEPRHPPCALSCFKKFRNCSCYLRQKKVTRYYNLLSQYVKELFPNWQLTIGNWQKKTADVKIMNLQTYSRHQMSRTENFQNWQFPNFEIHGGGYRNRTDDP